MLNSVTELASLSFRVATPADEDFLRNVFASTRTDELTLLAHDAQQAQAFVTMQFRMQQQNYAARYPAAQNQIILFAGQPIGRMLVDRSGDPVVLVDIAILDDFRNRGIGTRLVKGLMSEAAELGKHVALSVFKFNPALRLYNRLGFSIVADAGMYLEMKWSPDNTQSLHD